MRAKKVKKVKEVKGEKAYWYKGYDMRWLRNEPEHPDYYLVEKFEKKGGEK